METQPDAVPLVDALGAIYAEKHRSSEFDDERPVYQQLVPLLLAELAGTYENPQPFKLGSTASVWKITDKHLHQVRALKLPRPRLGRLKDIVRIVRAERERLAALNHHNIVKIYTAGEINLALNADQYSFPYYVMEFIEGVKDLDEFVLTHHTELTGDAFISLVRDVLNGLSFLHSQQIVHCDIKPGNLLVAPGRPALVADFGYAKHLARVPSDDSGRFTEVVYTQKYAHPELRKQVKESSDPDANRSEIPRENLRVGFDLFAMGRTLQQLLIAIRDVERHSPERNYGRDSLLSPYQWLYLGYVAKRLLDGIVENRGADEFNSDGIPGLPEHVMEEIKYSSAEDTLEDLEKLLSLYDLEAATPELNPHAPSYIQVPHCRVPLTRRVSAVITHPTFSRLAQVTQLGFVSVVYPGATHTRFEHTLGTMAHCCEYLRALWHDTANCLFRAVMTARDLDLCILASLLHDIGQYPMAHDLTEIATEFAHERFTAQALHHLPPGHDATLAQVIESEWNVTVLELTRVMALGPDATLRERLLNSVVNGPIDCDKLDYLKRDSTHLGVTFGLAVDGERLLRNLTIAYQQRNGVDGGNPEGRKQEVQASVAVTEKALVVAHSILKARNEMFTQVYWQHTVRALKAMLGFVARNSLARARKGDRIADFWAALQDFVIGPLQFTSEAARQDVVDDNKEDDAGEVFLEALEPREQWTSYTGLAPSDDSALRFLWEFSDVRERRMLSNIRSRSIFKRLAVLSGTRDQGRFDAIYDRFRTYRLDGNFEQMEQLRSRWESYIRELIVDQLTTDGSLAGRSDPQEVILGLQGVDPLILVDVPLKATRRLTKDDYLWYLPEDFTGVHEHRVSAFPKFDRARLDLEQRSFDREVGKIRVLVAPEWQDLAVRAVPEYEVLGLLTL